MLELVFTTVIFWVFTWFTDVVPVILVVEFLLTPLFKFVVDTELFVVEFVVIPVDVEFVLFAVAVVVVELVGINTVVEVALLKMPCPWLTPPCCPNPP